MIYPNVYTIDKVLNRRKGDGMITVEKEGTYKLIETKSNTKILYLDRESFAWVEPRNFGEMLVVTHTPHRTDCDLSMGRYNLYSVEDEPYLTDLQHLELEYGKKAWQGYLLPTGLPTDNKKRSRIIPTTQIITLNPRFSTRMGFRKVDQTISRIDHATTHRQRSMS